MRTSNTVLQREIQKYDHLFETNTIYNANTEHPRYDVAERFLKRCEGVQLVADIGTGRGIFLKRLQRLGLQVFAVEPSRIIIERLKSPFIVYGTCDDLPFASDLFDVVFCLDVLEHIPERLTDESLRELRRVTKRYTVLSVATHEDCVDHLQLHITLKPYAEWERILSRYFTIVDAELIHSKTYPGRTAKMYFCRKDPTSGEAS